MTNSQFEVFIVYSGMLQDGMKAEDAIASLVIMGESAEDISWLIEREAVSKAASQRVAELKAQEETQ